jgi:hypothetical protein
MIVAAQEAGIFALPAAFCAPLEGLRPDIQMFGLDRCFEMFRHRSREFADEDCATVLAAAAPVLRRGSLDVEPLKRLLRLMTAVIMVRKDAAMPAPAIRAVLMAAVKEELSGPRAAKDAALRGLLRDLQSALGGTPILVKPILFAVPAGNDRSKRITLPAAADRAVPRDSLLPIVH